MVYSVDSENLAAEDFTNLLAGLVHNDRENYKNPHKHPCYMDSVDHAEEMAVHMYGKKPEKLLNMVRPREDPEVKAYRLEAYQPTTKSTAEKALAIVSKIFNPTLYSIKWENQNQSGKELEAYAFDEYPLYNSVIHLLQQTALKKVLSDPNGVMAVKPGYIPETDAERIKPIVKIFGSKSVWYYDEEMFLIFIKKEKQLKGPDKYYFEYYDKFFYREFVVERVGRNKVNVYLEREYFHNSAEIPCWHLRGVPESKDDGNIYYRSYFDAALPFWNLAISHESDLFGAYINHLHPIRTELAEDCDYKDGMHKCKGGFINYGDGEAPKKCPSCAGTGRKSVRSPYGVYQINRAKIGEETVSVPIVDYVTVPTEPTKMLEERVDKLLEKSLYALNMDVLNKIGENQSGVAKVIDRDELYDYLYRISTTMFDIHLTNILFFFNNIMFGVSDANPSRDLKKNLPDIQKPTQFDIASAMDLMEEMKLSKDSGANPQFLREKQKQINNKEFSASPDIKNRLDLMLELDPCPELSVEEISLLVDKGQVTKKNAIIHHNIETFVDRALAENKKFGDMKRDEQMEILEEYAEEMIEENKVKLDTEAIDTTNTGGTAGFGNQQGNPKPGESDNPDSKNPFGQGGDNPKGA